MEFLLDILMLCSDFKFVESEANAREKLACFMKMKMRLMGGLKRMLLSVSFIRQ